MKFSLINPPWTFDGSIYFGCREPHLPLEYGYSRALLEANGHEVQLVDAQLHGLTVDATREQVAAFRPDFCVITTAPSYLFWRCAPPELRVPMQIARALKPLGATLIAVGPHASTTPSAAVKKLGVDLAVLGECEEVLVEIARKKPGDWKDLSSVAYRLDGHVVVQGGPHASDMASLPALRWPREVLTLHAHHHRFDAPARGHGAEVETTRGSPETSTSVRDELRRRPLEVVLEEIDALVAQGVEYLYFIDEDFMPNEALLEAMIERPLQFGVQLRIDAWSPRQLDLLGEAGCVSIEAGVESMSPQGRDARDKRCKPSTSEVTELLIHAKRSVPFVQANLLEAKLDEASEIEAWREHLRRHGVWANEPVLPFPYPGSPDYRLRWGTPDEVAWERAHEHYLSQLDPFSDVQLDHPLSLSELERAAR